MIEKILHIAHIGRFEEYSANGDVELKKVTTIFAENGKGKTTLSAIFRSLKSNTPIFITERTTLGHTTAPKVKIRIYNQDYTFDATWDNPYPKIEIFDSVFIDRNVFSGEHVEHEHKKNLYRFVVGETGVELAKKVDELVENTKNKTNEIGLKSTDIQKYIFGSNTSIDQFIGLKQEPNIIDLIKEKEEEIEAITKSKLLISKPQLQKIVLPDYPTASITALLQKQISDISKIAEEKTKKHISDNLGENGEPWIEEGIVYAKNNECPFCGQDIEGNHLISAYNDFFNTGYKEFKEEILSSSQHFNAQFSESTLIIIQRNITTNDSLFDFWKQYTPLNQTSTVSFDDIQDAWKIIRSLTVELYAKKNLSPLDQIQITNDLQEAIRKYVELIEELKKYNKDIDDFNILIQKKKLEAGGGDLVNSNKDLEKLKNISNRHTPALIKLCEEYQKLSKEKIDFEKQKKDAKKELDEYTDTIFQKYQENINKFLIKFGAGFVIDKTTTGYSGGKPSSSYSIKINDISVGLGDTRVFGRPCFRNILSQGDKNALAFAFFLARLEQDDDIENKILVFDDPICSLDEQRKTCTKQEILNFGRKSKQCIVMSHDKYFLRSVWNKCPSSDIKSLQIERSSTGSSINFWDIITDTKGEYFDDFYKMLEFIQNGVSTDDERRNIARCIRPVLEGYLRIKFPEKFKENEWLGDFISTVRASQTGSSLETFKNNHLDSIDDINEYSKKYHHRSNPNASSESINDTELKTHVERTLKLLNE
ncbi:AAA family ATPase [Candidatus Parcubacteria bacterium]|nr:AAA family ATPase [Candidatus Parcubacteria bacterium]